MILKEVPPFDIFKDVYAVYSTSVDRDYLIGYYRGDKKDIELLLDSKKGYGLKFEAVRPILVTSENANKVRELLQHKAKCEATIKTVDVELRKLGVLQ